MVLLDWDSLTHWGPSEVTGLTRAREEGGGGGTTEEQQTGWQLFFFSRLGQGLKANAGVYVCV